MIGLSYLHTQPKWKVDTRPRVDVSGHVFCLSASLEMHGPPTLYECLNNIRVSTPEEIQIQVQNDLLQSRMPTEYLSSLNDKDLTTAYWCCLLAWNVTGGTQIPCEME